MILYALLCQHDHQFDSWFDSSKAFDKLQKSALIECPHCGSVNIQKALMTPQLSGTRSNKQKLHTKAHDLARKIRNHVKQNADDVGDKFAQEARKIHFQEVKPHNIYGQATPDEVSDLAEDGIKFTPLPDLPEDKN